MSTPSAWTTPPVSTETPAFDLEAFMARRNREETNITPPADFDFAPPPVFRRLPDGTLVVAVRRVPEPVPGISDGLRRTLIAMALTTIIAISLGAIAWVRFAS